MANHQSKELLFTPGPVMMDKEVKDAGGEQAPYFRTKAFSELVLRCERKLCMLANAPRGSRVAFITGSGTLAMEAAVINFASKSSKICTVDGGVFGHRFTEMAKIHGIPCYPLVVDRDPLSDESRLNQIPKDVQLVFATAHETSIGHLYDIANIGAFCRKRHCLFIVDAISLFGADPVDMQKDNIDVMIFSSNKALGLSPGLSFLIISPAAQERLQEHPPSFYLNLKEILLNGLRGQTPFTPAISVFLQLDRKLAYLTADKFQENIKHTKRLAEQFREGVKDLPLRPYSRFMPNAFTSLKIETPSERMNGVVDYLKREYNVVIPPVKTLPTGEKLLRFSHMGDLHISDNKILLKGLHKFMQEKSA